MSRPSVAATGREVASDMAFAGQYFDIKATQAVKTVTATIHFTGINVADSTDAQSKDNAAYALAQIGASIIDSGCPDVDHVCGSTDALKHVWVDDEVQTSGVTLTPVDNAQPNTAGHVTNASADQTITVTLSSANGGNLPAGRVSFAGYTFAYSSLGDPQCTPPRTPADVPSQLQRDLPQTCLPDTPHTGTATTDMSATIASITYSVA